MTTPDAPSPETNPPETNPPAATSPAAQTPGIETPDAQIPDAQIPDTEETPGFGWTTYAERMNGRFAMVGFVALLVLEWVTRQDFFTWLGF